MAITKMIIRAESCSMAWEMAPAEEAVIGEFGDADFQSVGVVDTI